MNLWPFRWKPFSKKAIIARRIEIADEPVDMNDAVEQIMFSVLQKYKAGKCAVKLGFDIRYRVDSLSESDKVSLHAFDLAIERDVKYDTFKKHDDIVQCEYFDLSYWVHKSDSKLIPGKSVYNIQDVRLNLKKESSLSSSHSKSYNIVSTVHPNADYVHKFMREIVREYYIKESSSKEKHVTDILAELKKS